MKWFRVLMVGTAVALVLLAVGLVLGSLWLNSFIHSDAFRHDVETRVGETLGGTVEIKQIDFSLLSGVQLSGLATKMVTSQGTVVTQVATVSCAYSIGALLDRKLQLDGVTLVDPQIVITQQAPSLVPVPEPPAVASAQKPPTPGDLTSGKTAPFVVILKAAKIKNGHLSLQDATGVTKADLEGFQIDADTEGYFTGKDVTGTLAIAKISLPENLGAADFSTPFLYRTNDIEAGPFKLSTFDGRMSGSYQIDPTSNIPSVLEIDATGIDIAKAGQAAAPDLPTKLSGKLALQSKWTAVETAALNGEGDAQITSGKLEGVPILHDLAKALRVPEMSSPDLQSVAVHFKVANGTTRFSNLNLVSTAFEMTGSGVIDPQGNLNANMTLILHPDAVKRIPPVAVPFFTQLPGGNASIPFQLTGTALNPKSDALTHTFIESSKMQDKIKKKLKDFFH